jgi:hypothetical protein
MAYGIMYWGYSSSAERALKLQKTVVRAIKGCGSRDSCGEYFRDMYILALRSQYVYSVMNFVVKNREIFDTNNVHYEINTGPIMDTNRSQVNLSVYGKEVYLMAVRIHNALLNTLKGVSEDMKI